MGNGYWFALRPPDVSHRHPFLVFNCQDQLHFELTVFGKEAAARVEKKTVEGYLRALLPFFTYLETDEWQARSDRNWKGEPIQIRHAVEDYLIHQLRCMTRQHRCGFLLVLKTNQTQQTVKLFLSGLKFFYQVIHEREVQHLLHMTIKMVLGNELLQRHRDQWGEGPLFQAHHG